MRKALKVNHKNMFKLFKTKKGPTCIEAFNILQRIEGQVNPDLKDLETVVNYHEFILSSLTKKLAIRKKYKVMTQQLSPLEATMSVEQLFDVGNELWMRQYSINAITLYLYHIEKDEIEEPAEFLENLKNLND